jgi:hypothetical protein
MKKKNRFSFDDMKIGRLRDSGKSVDPEDSIERPPGLDRNAWYVHAGKVVSLLNELEKAQTTP